MHHLIFILSLLLFSAFSLYPMEAKKNSFSFDLSHRDSKASPFYDWSITESERSKAALIHSLNRLNHLNHLNMSMLTDAKYVQSDLIVGDYHMNIYMSKSNYGRVVIPSMSSDLTCIRCGTCSSNCKNQHQSPYDPEFSNTYHSILFGSQECKDIKGTRHSGSNECQYMYQHDEILSYGKLGNETFYFESTENVEKKSFYMVFGCDEAHHGNFKDAVQGVVGLGRGPFSLVSQLGKGFSEKFSYCLVDAKQLDNPSKIKFGSDLKLYNRDIKGYTVKVDPSHPSYHLNLQAISINSEKIKIPNKKHDMIVDIQTPSTSLPQNMYDEFIGEFKNQVGHVESIGDTDYDTCFNKHEFVKRPKVVFNFSHPFLSKGDFPVNPSTMFREYGDYMCLTLMVSKDGVSVMGNKAQVVVQMIFDLSSHSLTFAPVECHKVPY
ncbi:aspartic proteinase CDR1-like [Tripterygium wilfordii]|uniref:aspartic proteinase CDR1-like n=1 Tax=Tripterygium wilfordii TaxID=458696 RepID=UPI0018F860C0|nr:aspartic proteinase CDR1-like [Tripterygium wilfordii]